MDNNGKENVDEVKDVKQVTLRDNNPPTSVCLWKGFKKPVPIITCDIFTTETVIDVSLGKEHSLFLTKGGEVYSLGSNVYGQLGLGSLEVKAVSDLVKVDQIKDHVIQVSCGKYHNAAVTHHGQALCWGDSRDGQCGTGNLDIVTSPSCVTQHIPSGFCKEHGQPKPPIHVLFESVSCGGHHTLGVSTNGEVWAWGCGEPLGLGEILHAPVPRRVEGLNGKTVISVCCGDKHSLALVVKGDNNNRSTSSQSQQRASSSPKDKDDRDSKKHDAVSAKNPLSKGDSVTIDKHFPSRCNSCQKDIFTYTDVSDMCIIETSHDCEGDDNNDSNKKSNSGIDSGGVDDNLSPNLVEDVTETPSLRLCPSTNDYHSSNSEIPQMSSVDGKTSKQELTDDINFQQQHFAIKDKNIISERDERDCRNETETCEAVQIFDSSHSIDELAISPIQSDASPIAEEIDSRRIDSNVFEEDGFDLNKDYLSDVPDTTLDGSILIIPSSETEERDNVLPVISENVESEASEEIVSISPKSQISESGNNDGLTESSSKSNNGLLEDKFENLDQKSFNIDSQKDVFDTPGAKQSQETTEKISHNQDGHEFESENAAVKKDEPLPYSRKDVLRSVSQDSDPIVWKRQSACDDEQDKGATFDHPLSRPKSPSPSTCSVKSLPLLNQSDAMQYLKKQFDEDDYDADLDEEGKKRGRGVDYRRSRSVSGKPPSSLLPVSGKPPSSLLPADARKDSVDGGKEGREGGGGGGVLSGLGFVRTSSPTTLMKSITNRAMSSLQSLSVFSSTTTTTPTTTTTAESAGTFTSTMSPTSDGGGISSSVEMISFVSTSPSEPDDDPDGKMAVFSSPESCSMISSVSSLTTEGTDTPTSNDAKSSRKSLEEVHMRPLKSGTFIEWRKEMSSVDGDHVTSLNADNNPNSLRSLRTIELKKRNLSSSSSKTISADSLPTSPHRPVITTTEVYAWGCNKNGQLGLGDTIHRSQPVWLKYFSGRNVKKVSAGDAHSLALIDNSQVYSWGSNSHGQLGQTKSTDFPSRIKFQGGSVVWDVAAGSQHSILLVDTSSYRPDVFYCGKQPSDKTNASMKKALEPVAVPSIRQDTPGWLVQVHAGGSDCACQVWNMERPLANVLFELAATERTLYSQLIKTSNLLLRPLKKSSFFASMDVYPYKPALQNIIASFGILTTKVGKGVTDLTATIQHRRNPKESRLIIERREFIDVFRNYSQVFSNFLAIGGFEYCTKTGSQFFSEIQGNVQALSGEKDKTVAASSLFLRAMSYPFYRLSAYSRIFSTLAEAATSPEDRNAFENTKLDWDSLKSYLSLEHKLADTTKAFWDSTNSRLADAMRSTSRRLLKESKSHPLVLLSASRFSSASFILFNDLFVYSQTNSLNSYRLETLWVEAVDTEEAKQNQNLIVVTTPEERLELSAPNASVKAEWLMALQSAISKVLTHQKSMSSLHSSGERFTPPLIRHAKHVFTKQCIYRDAAYNGTWLSGKVHGLGEMTWPDGSFFKGNFKRGLMHGSGSHTLVKGQQGKEVQQGIWKDGKLNGYASIVYANGDLYEGYLKDGQRFGHGMLQMGRIKSNCACVYIGEWLANQRHGYGVEDHILKGEKYMGAWSEDSRHGNGIMVTLDGMYFEGTFVSNKMTGFGVMISDDDTLYEGDFMGITYLSGKGTLTLPQGDKLEGSFSGSLNEGLKVSGTFHKVTAASRDSTSDHHQHDRHSPSKSKYFGRLCVQADAKWMDIFSHVGTTLGQGQSIDSGVGGAGGGSGVVGQKSGSSSKTDTKKAWEVVAVLVSDGLKTLKEQQGSKAKLQRNNLQGLEMIPNHELGPLDTTKVKDICQYLEKAFESSHHPLGQLMSMLVDVFRASYIGVGAHPRLLHHAVKEIHSYIRRAYKILRILFPVLPESGYTTYYPPSHPLKSKEEEDVFVEGLEVEDTDTHILTAAGLLYPILLPKVYPPLFDLYALYNEGSDDRYWERVSKLNRQGDVGLLAYLGIEQQFWLVDEILAKDSTKTLSSIREECYAQAVEQLQQLSTAFSPLGKLMVIKEAFNEITKTVMTSLGDEVMWCMDDLFPIFQFVVVRAKIHHLGAEIHLIEDLMEPHLEHGEYGLMFTTLKACYFQIQNEKMPHH